MAPLAVQQAQQQNTEGALKLDQLREIMALSKQISGGAQNQGGNTAESKMARRGKYPVSRLQTMGCHRSTR